MTRSAHADPLARSCGVIGAEAPLFAPDVEPSKRVSYRPMAETSLAAHHGATASGKISKLKREVLDLCKREHGCTIDEAAVELGR